MPRVYNTIKTWSHSRLGVVESCLLRAKFQYVDKIPEPERPPRPDGKEHANDRGSRIHDELEQYIRGNGPLPIEAKDFAPEMGKLRELFKKGKVIAEDMWLFDDSWQPLPHFEFPKGRKWTKAESEAFAKIWCRIKLDALVFLSQKEAVVIDFKSGKRWGNEVKHAEQAQLYAVGTAIRYPKLEKITAELWYVDADEVTSMTFTRKQALRFLKGFNNRGVKITSIELPKGTIPEHEQRELGKPNQHTCRFCMYGPKWDGPCEIGEQ